MANNSNNSKKYASLTTLQNFLEKLKTIFAGLSHKHTITDLTDYRVDAVLSPTSTNPVQNKVIDAEFEAMADAMGALELAIDGKSNSGHSHDDRYYTELEVDGKLTTLKNDLLNGAGGAYDTLKELGDLIDDNTDAIEALERVASGKADSVHTHAITDVNGLQSALDGKASSSHGTHVTYSTTAPVMDGTASVGSATTVSRSDHKHPTDTSRASKTEFDTHTSNTTLHITSAERTNWNAAKTHADSAHAPSNAEKNQNAFSNIAVGSTTVAADTATDTVTFVGSNVTITPDASNDKITFSVADGSTSAKGIVQLTNSTSSTSTTTAATPNSVKSAYDLANTAKTNAATAQTRADSAYTLAESKVDSLSDLGITATAVELNYLDGAASNVQAQLDNKSNKNHEHSWNDLKNKPFGDEIKSEETLISNKTVSMYGDGWYRITPAIELIEGVAYKVTFNGTTYESIAWVSPLTGTICIGNGEIYGGEDYGNFSAPFAFEYDNGIFNLYSNDIGSATFSIIKVVTDVTKLNENFIPDTIARTSAVSQVQIITWEAND